jgi:prepilin-type N-terminal cleavage/methylation domain-containing protein
MRSSRIGQSEKREGAARGFTLVEVLVGTALFLVVAMAFYGAFTSLFQLASGSQARTLAVELADEQFEIVRNMPYINVGLTNDTIETPYGVLPPTQTLTRGGYTFTVNLTVRNINLSTTTVQASDKLVEVDVECPACKDFQPVVLTGQVSPANLQSASNGGAIVVHVFDASTAPVEDASTTIQSVATSTLHDTDVTDNNGTLNVIGVSPGNSMYHIIVNKPGYSTDQTYAAGGSAGPTPSKPNINVLNQQVTNISFAIDRLSSLHFTSVDPTCLAVPSYHFSLAGSKLIATNPSTILKYPATGLQTGAGGTFDLNSMEWDTYTVTPTDISYDVEGINPPSPFALNPGNSQSVQLVVVPHTPNTNSLMVSVTDKSSSKLPISGATVELTGPNGDQIQTTGVGYLAQTDWSGGSGSQMFGLNTSTKYYQSSGVDTQTASSSGNIQLHWNDFGGPYNTTATGTLESSTFDTGTTSNFYTLSWKPSNQPQLAGAMPVKFQFATKPTSTSTFSLSDYLGPNGTHNTYFTVPSGAINSISNNNEFARYMAYLTTNTATVTPSVSDIAFSYTSGCIPPGQVLFQGLSASIGGYTLSVGKPGYATTTISSVSISSAGNGWQQKSVPIGP